MPYIASLKPGVLAPTGDALTEAQLHEALGFLSAELHKAFGPSFGNPPGDARETAMTKLTSRLGFVEKHLSDGRETWLTGDFSVADAYAFVLLSWADHFDISYDSLSNIARYVERISSRRSVQKALQEEGAPAGSLAQRALGLDQLDRDRRCLAAADAEAGDAAL